MHQGVDEMSLSTGLKLGQGLCASFTFSPTMVHLDHTWDTLLVAYWYISMTEIWLELNIPINLIILAAKDDVSTCLN